MLPSAGEEHGILGKQPMAETGGGDRSEGTEVRDKKTGGGNLEEHMVGNEMGTTGKNLRRDRAPLYEKLIACRNANLASFHVPGHKSGNGLDPAAYDVFRSVMSIDLTEITGLDDLYHPTGVIAEAQQLAADCFGAEESYFLVNGSTVGNLAMILSVCDRDDLILVQRNVHKSVLHGLMLAGARAVFLPPRWDKESGIATGVDPADVREALRLYPGAKALLITNPNYYGMSVDIRPIAELMHAHGKPLLVDEAHGAHFGFHPAFPPSALSCGADAVVQSTHKMLTAMTMGAMLHVQGGRINRMLLRQRIGMLQSSSPSYPIMASLDLSRRQLHMLGASAFEEGLAAAGALVAGLKKLARFQIVEAGPDSAYDMQDPFKVAVRDAAGSLSGFALQRELEQRGCMTEMADPQHVLLVFTMGSTRGDSEKLLNAFAEIGSLGPDRSPRKKSVTVPGEAPIRQISAPIPMRMNVPGASPFSENGPGIRKVMIREAAGHISAEMVIPYPPGIPVLFPGERIAPDVVRYLEDLLSCGARFQGTQDGTIRVIV